MLNHKFNSTIKSNKLLESIYEQLNLLDMQLYVLIEKLKKNSDNNKSSNRLRGLIITTDEVDEIINNSNEESFQNDNIQQKYKEMERYKEIIESKVKKNIENDIYMPLVHVQDSFGLNDYEMKLIIMCLAIELHIKYEKIYSYLNDDVTKKRPTIELMMKLLEYDIDKRIKVRSQLNYNAKIFKYGFIHRLNNDDNLLTSSLKLDQKIVDFIIGDNLIDKKIRWMVNLKCINNMSIDSLDDDYIVKISDYINNRLSNSTHRNQKVVLNFFGVDYYRKKEAVYNICKNVKQNLLIVDVNELKKVSGDIRDLILLIEREAILQNAILCFDGIDSNDNIVNIIFTTLGDLTSIIIMLSKRLIKDYTIDNNILCISKEYKELTYLEIKDLWLKNSKDYTFDNSIDFYQIANKFYFNDKQIKRVLNESLSSTMLRCNSNGTILSTDIHNACRLISENNLNDLAVKVDVKYSFDDIILSENKKIKLKDMCNRIRNKHIVFEKWGFDRKLSYGKGLSAVFFGSSGTGKTMAAQIIANELEVDLYRVDLSQIISKYIGETEKNLEKIFKEASKSNAILFFDEADALFGKRSEVKDARDRYANMETSYLLQKMEEYTGITILATNLKNNMDDAFKRRLDYCIEFPYPDVNMRKKIWEVIFPKETPIDKDVDFDNIAKKIELAGGSIKNIALKSAFLAAEEGTSVTSKHIFKSAVDECRKMGKSFDNFYE